MLSTIITFTVLWKIGIADTGIEWLFSANLILAELAKNFVVLSVIFCIYRFHPRSALLSSEVFFVGVMFGATLLGFFVVASRFNGLFRNSSLFLEFAIWSPMVDFLLKQIIFGLVQTIVIFTGVFMLRAARSRL